MQHCDDQNEVRNTSQAVYKTSVLRPETVWGHVHVTLLSCTIWPFSIITQHDQIDYTTRPKWSTRHKPGRVQNQCAETRDNVGTRTFNIYNVLGLAVFNNYTTRPHEFHNKNKLIAQHYSNLVRFGLGRLYQTHTPRDSKRALSCVFHRPIRSGGVFG